MTEYRSNFLVALGSNLENGGISPLGTLQDCLQAFSTEGLRLVAVSRFFSTPCFPAGAGPDYVNGAVAIEADCDASEVLTRLHRIESRFRRTRTQRWAMRTLDLDLLAAANHCFRVMGLGDMLSPATDAKVALRGGKRMLTEGLTRAGQFKADTVEEYYPLLLAAYRDAIATHTVMYPGAMEAVEALKLAGYGVGICTNKPEALAEQLMRSFGVRDVFAALVGADTLPVRKPDPEPLFEAARRAGGDPAKTILIGDSDTDRNTSANAGVPSVLVTFGPAGGDMAALKPEALLHRYEDLPGVVARLIG